MRDRTRPLAPTTEEPEGAIELYRVVRRSDGGLDVQTADEGMMRELQAVSSHVQLQQGANRPEDAPLYFVADRRPDGRYSVTLTDDGLQRLETALGVASDLGRDSAISNRSSIADIMERTATREHLSEALRSGQSGTVHRALCMVLRRRLRGSERPTGEQRAVSHVGKMVIVAVVGLWSLQQVGIALQDLQAIPGILGNIPSDIFHLQPTAAFDQVGATVGDAENHVGAAALGGVATYITARVVKPLSRIYRKDQLVPGERPVLTCLSLSLQKASRRLS